MATEPARARQMHLLGMGGQAVVHVVGDSAGFCGGCRGRSGVAPLAAVKSSSIHMELTTWLRPAGHGGLPPIRV